MRTKSAPLSPPAAEPPEPRSGADPSARAVSWLWGLGIAVYFLVLAMIFTWPLVTRMGSAMVGQVGDNIYFVWMIGWLKKALLEGANPFNVWFLNYPEGWNLAYTEITPAQILLALPFALIAGPTFGYNAAMLLTFVLSGTGMYLWVRRLTGRREAALLAGTIFAFLPYRFAHFLIGHLNLIGTQWFPIYFWGLYEVLSAPRFAWKPALLAGISLGLIALTSQYYLYMALLVTAVMALVYLLFLHREKWRERAFWKLVGATALSALPLVLVGIAPYVLLLNQGGLPDRNLGIVRPYSASPTDYLLPSTDHFLWGRWVGTHFNRDMWVEGTLYVGAVSLALAVAAWVKRRITGHADLLKIMLWGGLFALLLSLGTDLHWNGAPVEITTPALLARFTSRETLPIPLPAYGMFLYFPFFAKLRAFMRFGVFVLVFCSAVAGLGAAHWLGRLTARSARVLAVILIALVLVDFYPGPYREFTSVEARPVDAWLAAQPGQGAVIQFPFWQAEDQQMTYYTLVHQKPYVGGFFNAFPPAQYARIKPLMGSFPDQQSVSLFEELGVQWVLVDSAQYPDMAAVRAQSEQLGLKYVTTAGEQWVFEARR